MIEQDFKIFGINVGAMIFSVIPEINTGQLRQIIRAKYLVDAIGLNQIQGKPLGASTIVARSKELLK